LRTTIPHPVLLAVVLPPGEETAAKHLADQGRLAGKPVGTGGCGGEQVRRRSSVTEGGLADFADFSAAVRELLAGTLWSALQSMDQGLTDTTALEQLLIVARAGYLGMVLATTVLRPADA
jgi:hypothetical protein